MDGLILLIVVAIACFFILKWDNNVESKHKEKERKRLKISEEDYLKAHKSLKSPLLSREQQEEQIRRHNFEETKARVHREAEERNRKLKEESKE
jgi:hypothetical protein